MKKKVITALIILGVLAGGVGYKMHNVSIANTAKTVNVEAYPKIETDNIEGDQTMYTLPWSLDNGQEVTLESHKINKDVYKHEFVGRFIQTDEDGKENNMKTIFFDHIEVLKIGANEKLRVEVDATDTSNVKLTIWVPEPSWIDMKIDDPNVKQETSK